MDTGHDDSDLVTVYTLGGALALILSASRDAALHENKNGKDHGEKQGVAPIVRDSLVGTTRRKLDGSIAIARQRVLKNLLIQGEAIQVEGGSKKETRYLWHCPAYPDCPVGYQLLPFPEKGQETKQEARHGDYIFCYPEMVFDTAELAMGEILSTAPKRELPKCYSRSYKDNREKDNVSKIAIQPLFIDDNTSVTDSKNLSKPAQYLQGGAVLGIRVALSSSASEEQVNSALLDAAAHKLFQLPAEACSLEYDTELGSLALAIKGRRPVRLHLAVERA